MSLRDKDGTFEARGLVELARANPGRFRSAIPFGPTAGIPTGLERVFDRSVPTPFKDLDGNVWLPTARGGWGVLVSNRFMLIGAKSASEDEGEEDRSISFVSLIGDGRQVLAFYEKAPAELLAIRNGRITKIRECPELSKIAEQARHSFLDRQGRLWFYDGYASVGVDLKGEPKRHAGRIFMQDQSNGLWFEEKQEESEVITLIRWDASGSESRICLEGHLSAWCEESGGALWVSCDLNLSRIAIRDGRLWETQRLPALGVDRLFFDIDGRLWASRSHFGALVYAVGR